MRIHNIIPVLNKMRVIKTTEEISLLQEAGSKTDLVLKEALNRFQLGMTENDLVAEIEYQAKKAGAEQMAFGTSVLSEEKSALPHGNPTSKLLKQGVILIDYGMVINGYCSDMTRTFHIGPWEEKMRKIYETVLEAEKEAIQQVKIGMTFAEVDAIARDLIDQAGYGEYFIHRLGHGMGLDVHEYPSLGSGNNERVETGMVFTIEPGVYVPNLGGVRIEDAVVMGPDGAHTLTRFPKETNEVIL
jgi:Xaa-Pro dipeptidase